jgi:GNAT superfamily N-acetyltransferase
MTHIGNDIELHIAGKEDFKPLSQLSDNDDFLDTKFRENKSFVIAKAYEKIMGYAIINWSPKYQFYNKLSVPEIQGLFVKPDSRKSGIGSQIIKFCEIKVKEKEHKYIGISVPLHSEFGAAQRLYVALGYRPDGYGVTYDRKPVQANEIKPIDENLCLMLIKKIQKV